MTHIEQTQSLRKTVATACRVMVDCGLAEHVFGHVSARSSTEQIVVRCRGEHEAGLAYTTADDIRPVPLVGTPELAPWTAPKELRSRCCVGTD